jgi:hypothetical protein
MPVVLDSSAYNFTPTILPTFDFSTLIFVPAGSFILEFDPSAVDASVPEPAVLWLVVAAGAMSGLRRGCRAEFAASIPLS